MGSITQAMSAFVVIASGCKLRPIRLTVEHLEDSVVNPGIDLPRFSWALEAPEGSKNISTAWHRVQVSLDPAGPDLWDSGWIESANSIDIAAPSPLKLPEASTVFWQARSAVRVGSTKNWNMVPCAASNSSFRTGVADWKQAQWICKSNRPPVNDCSLYAVDGSNAAPAFRADFDLSKQFSGKRIASAKAFVSGMGHYNLYVNGEHVNAERYLDPGPASYRRRVYYNSFDVTGAVKKYSNADGTEGKIAVGIVVGNGWFNPLPFKFWGRFDLRVSQKSSAVGPPAAILRLRVTFDDGTSTDAVTNAGTRQGEAAAHTLDTTWKVAGSALLRNDLYLGNVFDFNREQRFKGWSKPGYDDSAWSVPVRCNVSGESTGLLQPQPTLPIRRRPPYSLTPKWVKTLANGNMVVDMGLNFGGVATLQIDMGTDQRYSSSSSSSSRHRTAGTILELKYGEILFVNGSVNPLTSTAGQIKKPGCCGKCAPPIAYQRDVIILPNTTANVTASANGASTLTFTPAFTWHGFRYIEVSALASLAHEADGAWTKYDRGLPRGLRINFTGVPFSSIHSVTAQFESSNKMLNDIFDMAVNTHLSNMMGQQSDCPHRERFGYTGDALATMDSSFMLFDSGAFYEKRVRDVMDAQHSDGGITECAPDVSISGNGLGNGSGPIGWDSYFTRLQLGLIRHHGNFHATSVRDPSLRKASAKWIAFLDNAGKASEHGLGDWEAVQKPPLAISGRAFVASNYQAWSAVNSMGFLGDKAVAAAYEAKELKQIDEFNQRFLDRSTGLYWDNGTEPSNGVGSSSPIASGRGNGGWVRAGGGGAGADGNSRRWEWQTHVPGGNAARPPPAHHPPTQAGQGLALGYGMVPDTAAADRVAKGLAGLAGRAGPYADKLTGGMFSIEWVLKGLSRGGDPHTHRTLASDTDGHDRAFAMTTTSEFPSYGYMLAQNATTIWEVWRPSNSTYSHNHPMFSGVVPWMVNVLAGVEVARTAVGGDRLLFAPLPPSGAKLMWAKGALQTPLGRAECSWRCDGNGGMSVNISVPVDTVATVVLPSSGPVVSSNGGDASNRHVDEGGWFKEVVGSGNWSYSTATPLCLYVPVPPPTPAPSPWYATCAKVEEIIHETPMMWLGGCAPGKTIGNVTFASWGTPTGDCSSGFKIKPKCHAPDSVSAVSRLCIGKAACKVPVALTTFGKDPCDGTTKWLAAKVECKGDANS